MRTYDDPDNYSISVLWYTDQRVEAIKALRKAGENHNVSLMACKRALESLLAGTFGSKTDPNEWNNGLRRNSTLILRASSIQKELDAEREQRAKDAEMFDSLKQQFDWYMAHLNGHEYDEFGHYVGKVMSDEDYAAFGRAVFDIFYRGE